MNRRLRKATRNWLRAERRGGDEAAERALARVFRNLPMPVPSAALASRTLAELGLSPASAWKASLRPHWAFRWAVATALGLSGSATAIWAPTLLSPVSLSRGANWIVDVGAGFLTAISRRLAISYTLWDVVGRAGATAADAMATPQVLGLMLATVLFGLLTFRALAGVVAAERSSYHV